jgi:hypothetical protein
MRRSIWISLVALAVAVALLPSRRAAAAGAPPLVHPIYVHLPDTQENATIQRLFTAAATRIGLRPVEVVDVPAPPPPKAPDLLKIALINSQKLAFDDMRRDLDAAAAEVAATGGAGLSTDQLSDLYLQRAMAVARADWNATAAAPPSDARTQAYADYLRAATMTPGRKLNPRELPPQAVADFERAAEEIRRRGRGTLLVRGSASAEVALDGGALTPVAGGITFRDLAYGEHLVHVEEIGRAPWGATVVFDAPSLDLDIPPRAPLALDDATAATHARRMGARFALVGEPKGGPGAPIGLRLVDEAGMQRDATLVTGGAESGLLDAAVMRLDEQARRIAQVPAEDAPAPPTANGPPTQLGPAVLLSAPREKARFGDDPAAWARDRWPLLTAAGALVLTAILLGAAVASDR